jgi:hypothetical protein
MDKVAILAELKALANDVPDFASYEPTSRAHLAWIGRTHALIARWDRLEAIGFSSAADFLPFQITRANNVAKMLGILHRAIADLELQVPALPNQAFGPGAVYDFLKSLRDLLGSATTSVFVVDPYLDEGIFDAYLSVVPAQVAVRLLTREYAAALKPAVQKFIAQKKMTVEVRISKAIHDRVVFIDGRSCWVLGASIKDAAKAKPTYLAPLAADAVSLKLADYEQIWSSATSL